jgi:hypothetical protein
MTNSGVVTETPEVCDCGGEVRWESILDPYRERWLGTCECGNMQAFLPDIPAWVTEDPLTTFLVGPELKTRPRERPPAAAASCSNRGGGPSVDRWARAR